VVDGGGAVHVREDGIDEVYVVEGEERGLWMVGEKA